MEDYTDVCEKMDELTCQLFELQTRLLESKREQEHIMKSGFLNMAKAKKSMGGNRVSILQVNTCEMLALIQVKSTESTGSGVKYRVYEPAMRGSETEEKDSNMRKRKDKGKTKQEDKENIDKDIPTNVKNAVKNPLRWFGVLVPEVLRKCQDDFERAAELSLKIATLQSQINAIISKYSEYKNIKASLKQS